MKIVGNPQNQPKQSGATRLTWKEVPVGVCCGGCIYEDDEIGICGGVEFPDGKTCLDVFHETGKNAILVEIST